MKRRVNYARRKARGGKGLIPPNPDQWENEHNGLDLRHELTIAVDAPLPALDAFRLLPHVSVHPHGAVPAADIYLKRFRNGSGSRWCGLGMSLPDGTEMVLFNDSHPPTRVQATLMEEFFHIWLDHPRSAVRIFGKDGPWRDYDAKIEGEAYGSGAAALVPYVDLKRRVLSGETDIEIARDFDVSPDLVRFRAKVTKLYGRLKRA